jgi:hypothetical protein
LNSLFTLHSLSDDYMLVKTKQNKIKHLIYLLTVHHTMVLDVVISLPKSLSIRGSHQCCQNLAWCQWDPTDMHCFFKSICLESIRPSPVLLFIPVHPRHH